MNRVLYTHNCNLLFPNPAFIDNGEYLCRTQYLVHSRCSDFVAYEPVLGRTFANVQNLTEFL